MGREITTNPDIRGQEWGRWKGVSEVGGWVDDWKGLKERGGG